MIHQCPYCGDAVEAAEHGPDEVLPSCFCNPQCEEIFRKHFLKKTDADSVARLLSGEVRNG